MIDYKAIADAIPATELNAAMAELAIEYPSRKRTKNGLVDMLDNEGSPILESGKFMTDTVVVDAFNAIKALSSTVAKSGSRQTYTSLSAVIGLAATTQLEKGITDAIAAGVLSEWVGKALNNDGIDITDPQVSATLLSLDGQYGIDTTLIEAVADAGKEQVLVFQGLKVGHVQNALQKRARGLI